jgi:fructose-1,6-bisphosphatase/inositol monophosphatase family enzyme
MPTGNRRGVRLPLPVDAVTTLLDEIAQTVVVPRFRQLARHEILVKATEHDSDDMVTVVDREVEAQISNALTSIAPSVPVIGEEGAHERPELLDLLRRDEPVWVVDPIDGTKNFAAGSDAFGIMLAYVTGGEARAAWIVMPARRETYVAEEGSGVLHNGERIRMISAVQHDPPRGAVMTRFMPEALGATVRHATRHVHELPPTGAAAVEYTDVLTGRRDFIVYYRLLPWDHAAPALVMTEAGGHVRHLDGSRYTARSPHQVTLVARSTEMVQALRERIRSDIGSG